MSTRPAEQLSPSLVVVEADPLNAETRLSALGGLVTPTSDFFIRSSFDVPEADSETWSIRVTGLVERELGLTLRDLQAAPRLEHRLTIECAGNGRKLMSPLPSGLAWGFGAVGTATFAGASLRHILEQAGVQDGAVEVVFRGADGGEIQPGRDIAFERSLPIAEALRDDVFIAYEMNGSPLTPAHGFPARLVVPGYYGVAWVKWLTTIEVVSTPFRGYFQAERYVYRNDPDVSADEPVRRMRVRSLITSVADGDSVPFGPCVVRGIAWSGEAPISRVEISDDGGRSWIPATLTSPAVQNAAVEWEAAWAPRAKGEVSLLVRANDARGNRQRNESVKNVLGYGNNVIQQVSLRLI